VTLLKIARVFTILAIVAFVSAWAVSLFLESRAVLAQRVDPHPPDLAALLGEAGTPIGTPQRLVIFDQAAFMDGTNPDGSRLVNEQYLTRNNLYPLQWKTVEFFRNAFVIGSGIAGVLFALLWWNASRSRRTRAVVPST
jgi:hypothetical protein